MPATFPALDTGGTAYHLQLWSTSDGGLPVWVGIPGVPDIATPALETLIKDFANTLAAHLNASVTHVARFQTGRTEI